MYRKRYAACRIRVYRMKPICKCKGIRKSAFLKHMKAGLMTIEELQKATGAGSGSCKGKHCTERIKELIRNHPG